MTTEFENERKLEEQLRKQTWLIPSVTLFTGALLFCGVVLCAYGFNQRLYWIIIPAGILVHSFFIVIVHDGAHKAITRTKFDSVIMNAGAGLMLLPFYAEPFRKYHLIHHANTNSGLDPLWPELKKKLYTEKRWLYLLCELIPLGFTFVLLLNGNKGKEQTNKMRKPNQPSIRWGYIVLAFIISSLLIYACRPPLWFVLGTLFCVNIVKLFRHWCEHMGTDEGKESNTYWFPLGMGIGNHEAHHHLPHYSWLTMMIGLSSRKKDTDPVRVLYLILFDRSFMHYKEIKK